jgi:putative membrane protein
MWYWHGMGWWGWLVMVAFWALVIVLIVWALRTSSSTRSTGATDPLRILDERFARGEIDSKEYEDRRAVLQAHR